MIKIKFIGETRLPGLIRSPLDQSWANTPAGFPVRAGGGPTTATCLMCVHFDLAQSVWSDHGRAAVCLESRRLSRHKADPPVVPACWSACSRFFARPGMVGAIATANVLLDERILEKRNKIEDLRRVTDRLRGEVTELQELQRDAQGAQPDPRDPGDDLAWKGFEPVNDQGD